MSYGMTLSPLAKPVLVEQAQLSDLDTVLAILEEAAQWITAKGINQWYPGCFRDSERREEICASLQRGEVYLAILADGQIVGTVTLQSVGTRDQQLWKERAGERAFYIHALAVRRLPAAKGVGRYLLHWCEEMALLTDIYTIRLDCMAENHALCTYYEQSGFTRCGEAHHNAWNAKLYEKNL